MKPFDERLFIHKLREPSRWMQTETVSRRRRVDSEQRKLGQAFETGWLVKRIDSDISVLREYLPKVDQSCRETWLSDHDAFTPDFIRREIIPRMFTQIATREGSIRWGLELLAKRTRLGGTHLTPALHHVVWQIEHLKNDLTSRYEIEAIELTKQIERKAAFINIGSAVTTTRSISEFVSAGKRDGEANIEADQWHDFHEKFQALAQKELNEGATQRNSFLRGYFTYRNRAEILQVQRDACWAFALLSDSDKLPAEPSVVNTGISAYGPFCVIESPECGLWVLSDCINENFRETFQTLGTRVGVVLGSPNGTDPLYFWLHRLILDLRANNSSLLFGEEKGDDGIILRICEASAIYCSRLERKSLKKSADARPEIHIQAADPQHQNSTFVSVRDTQPGTNALFERASGRNLSDTSHANSRLKSTVNSAIAAKRMEAYWEAKAISQTDFASQIGTTDRTLRAFRKTGRIRRNIFDSIAKGMGLTKQELMKPE